MDLEKNKAILKGIKCQNPLCYNFTSNHDLGGTWCCNECFIEVESQAPRITRRELYEMKVDYDWDLEEWEKSEIAKMGIKKSKDRLANE